MRVHQTRMQAAVTPSAVCILFWLFRIVSSSPELERTAANDWLNRCNDQDFSLTNAVSFSVMSQRGIGEALALDQHFVVAGFEVVPHS